MEELNYTPIEYIPINNKYGRCDWAIVDADMFEYLNKFKWSFDGKGYIKRHNGKNNGKYVKKYLHHEILPKSDIFVVDHKTNNKQTNTRDNLRYATVQENGMNQLKQKRKLSSIYKGVYYDSKNNKFVATTKDKNKKSKFLGRYTKESDAALAYNIFVIEEFGEFAKPNIIIKDAE